MALKRTTGNFLNFVTRNFPLDCEGLDSMQQNEALISILGNIGGDKYILKGCNAPNYEGYVFLATAAAPDGELLYVEPKPAGLAATYLHLITETVDIAAQGYNYAAAYSKRWLAWGVGTEQFAFADFMQMQTNSALSDRVTVLEKEERVTVPQGVIVMWSGAIANIPKGWQICDGNNGVPVNGQAIPDLRGRFVVGYDSADNDYNQIGNKDGEKQHVLAKEELPNLGAALGVEKVYVGTGDTGGNGNPDQARDSDSDTADALRKYVRNSTRIDNLGSGLGHENRPPYYVLAYIIKV